MQLSEGQKRFFDDFGFLQLPSLMKDRIEGITADFEAVFTARGGGHGGQSHDGQARSCIVPFIDQSVNLSGLLDDERIAGIAAGLLGDDWNYMGSDGNFYVGDTTWHPDGAHCHSRYIKIAFYLDRVTRETGALRVLPGSHRRDENDQWRFRGAPKAYEIEGRDVPSLALESTPGDVVVFNHNLMHAAFGGSNRRRMFTINLSEHAASAAAIQVLEDYVGSHARFWIDEPFGPAMMRSATPERKRHLQQVIDHAGHLPELSAKARQTMKEPARG